MASFLTGLCFALISLQLAAGALQQYAENQNPAVYPYHKQNLEPQPPQYQFQNQYPQEARLQAQPNLVYVGANPAFEAPRHYDIYQHARSLCDALVGTQSPEYPHAFTEVGPEDKKSSSKYASSESKNGSQFNVKDAAGASPAATHPFPHPLQPFRAACNQLYEQQMTRYFPRLGPAQGPAPQSAAAPQQAPIPATTGADGPDVTELAQLQARFAGVQLREALAEETFAKRQMSAALPAKLEQLEPDAELIPGAQKPPQQAPPMPVNPGLLPGQGVYIVHRQPNLYGQNPLYNGVPGAYGPKSGVPLPGGYQKFFIVDPQSGLDPNYPTRGVQGFPQPFYGNQGSNQQPGVPLHFGQGGLRSRPGSVLTQPGFYPGFGQPLELSYNYQPRPGTPYLPNQFVGQLKQEQVQSDNDEPAVPSDALTTTETQKAEPPTDVKASESAEKPVVATSSAAQIRRRKEHRGSRYVS